MCTYRVLVLARYLTFLHALCIRLISRFIIMIISSLDANPEGMPYRQLCITLISYVNRKAAIPSDVTIHTGTTQLLNKTDAK